MKMISIVHIVGHIVRKDTDLDSELNLMFIYYEKIFLLHPVTQSQQPSQQFKSYMTRLAKGMHFVTVPNVCQSEISTLQDIFK